jgi:hypothetical protein
MRGLRLELSAATHFARRARKFAWPEMTGEGTFDLLVQDVGPRGLEIECKAIPEDKGRKIHKREVLDFYRLLWPHIQSTVKGLSTGRLGDIRSSTRPSEVRAAIDEVTETNNRQAMVIGPLPVGPWR